MGTKRPDLLTETPQPEEQNTKQNGHRDDLEGTAFKGKISRFEKLSQEKTSPDEDESPVNLREPIYDMLSELERTASLKPSHQSRSFIDQQRSMDEQPTQTAATADPHYDRVAEYSSGGQTPEKTNDLMQYHQDDDIYGDAQFALYDNFHAKLDSSRNQQTFAAFPVISNGGPPPAKPENPPDIYDNLENARKPLVNVMTAAERLKDARQRVDAKLPDFVEDEDCGDTVVKEEKRDKRSPLKSSVRATSPAISDTGTVKSVKWLDVDDKEEKTTKKSTITKFTMGNDVVDFDACESTPSSTVIQVNGSSSNDVTTNGTKSSEIITNGTRSSKIMTNGSRSVEVVTNGSRSSDIITNGSKSSDKMTNGSRSVEVVNNGSRSPSVENGIHTARSVTVATDYLTEQPLYANESQTESSPAVDLHARASADRELENVEAEKERNRLDDILNLCARYERQLDYELLPAERDPNIHGKNAIGGSLCRMKTNGSLTRDVSAKVDACMGGPKQCHTPPGAPLMKPLRNTAPSAVVASPTRYEDYNSLARSHGVSVPKPVQTCDEIRNKLSSLRNHRDILTASIQDLKSQITLIEQQQNEAINQENGEKFELEQALLDGESKTTEDIIQAKIDQLKLKQLDTADLSNKQMNRIQAEIDAARETLKFLETEQSEINVDLNDPKGERSNELRRRLSSNTDRCEAKRRAIDDLEFQILEIETALEASKDNVELQLTVEYNNLKHPEKIVDQEIEQQKKEMKNEFKNELRKMELVRKQCIKDYQKGNTMLREIEGNITSSEELLSEKLKLENMYTATTLKKQEMMRMPATLNAMQLNQSPSRRASPSISRASLNSPVTNRGSTDSRINCRSSDGSTTPSSMSEFASTSINSTDEIEKRLSSSEDTSKSEIEQLEIAKLKNRELEIKLEKEKEIRSELVEQAIVLRNKQNQLQSRPLTRFLPVKEMADFNLRDHVETSGHCLDSLPSNMVSIDSTSCRGYLMKLGARGLKSWNKRWFVFDRSRHALMYYVDRDERKLPKATIYFQAIEQVFVEPSRKRISGSGSQKRKSKGGDNESSSFVVKTSQRLYVLTAPNPQCMRLWIDVIFTGAEGNKDFD